MSLCSDEKGIYITETKFLSLLQIQNRKHNFEQHIIRVRDHIADLKMRIISEEKKLKSLEFQLQQLSTPEAEAYIVKLKTERAEAEAKAISLMREVLGEELFNLLETKKWCSFTAKDGGTYKITNQGYVYRRINKEWKKLCIIRPRELPLPDFVLAALINVREHPKHYNLRFRR